MEEKERGEREIRRREGRQRGGEEGGGKDRREEDKADRRREEEDGEWRICRRKEEDGTRLVEEIGRDEEAGGEMGDSRIDVLMRMKWGDKGEMAERTCRGHEAEGKWGVKKSRGKEEVGKQVGEKEEKERERRRRIEAEVRSWGRETVGEGEEEKIKKEGSVEGAGGGSWWRMAEEEEGSGAGWEVVEKKKGKDRGIAMERIIERLERREESWKRERERGEADRLRREEEGRKKRERSIVWRRVEGEDQEERKILVEEIMRRATGKRLEIRNVEERIGETGRWVLITELEGEKEKEEILERGGDIDRIWKIGVDEDLSLEERRLRWKILEMVRVLRAKGRKVEVTNRELRVEGRRWIWKEEGRRWMEEE